MCQSVEGIHQLALPIVLAILAASPVLAEPPFQGTAFLSPDIITPADPSGLTDVTYTGRGNRTIWDYRVADWISVNAYLFEVRIGGRSIEFQVNAEFGSVNAARAEVDTYALALGRLPAVLLSRAEKVHVNAGDPEHPDAAQRGHLSLGDRVTTVFGGNYFDRSFTIHTGYGQRILRDGFLEEVLFHEGAHVSLQDHQDALGWRSAQEADGEYISDYARDFPDREDVAESALPYFAIRYRPDVLSAGHAVAITDTIPNRLAYFDDLTLDWSPYTPAVIDSNRAPVAVGTLPDVRLPELHAALDVDVSLAFDDPDGDPLTYAVSSSALQVVTVSGAGTRVTLMAVSAGAATVQVTATDPGGRRATQSFTVTVTATVGARFTDDPLRPGVTPIRAMHFTELRGRVNALREAAGLGRYLWTDPVLRAGVTPVRLAHLTELRRALEAAYTAAGRPVPRWTDPRPAPGRSPIRALHLTELRAAVIAIE